MIPKTFKTYSVIVIALQCLFTSTNYSRDYIPIPTTNARWYETYDNRDCFISGGTICSYNESLTVGDTIINTVNYTKINTYQSEWPYLEYQLTYQWYVRNSDDNSKLISSEGDTIYNFALEVSDTFKYGIYTSQVKSIDSILINEKYRKRMNCEVIDSIDYIYFSPFTLIEGIGSIDGIHQNVGYAHDEGYYEFYTLICMELEGQKTYSYSNNQDPCPSFMTSLETINANSTKIYPIPAQDYINISNANDLNRFEIITISGVIIKTGVIATKINVSDLSTGYYLLKLYTAGNTGTIVKSFVIQ